jgi:hypothetical protein
LALLVCFLSGVPQLALESGEAKGQDPEADDVDAKDFVD